MARYLLSKPCFIYIYILYRSNIPIDAELHHEIFDTINKLNEMFEQSNSDNGKDNSNIKYFDCTNEIINQTSLQRLIQKLISSQLFDSRNKILINDLIYLQNQIYDLSNIGVDEVLKSIKESYFIESKVYFTEILLTINKSIESCNKTLHDDYYLLINSLKPDIQKYFLSHDLCFNIFPNNEIRLKLLPMDLINIQDIILLIKLHHNGPKKESLLKTFQEYIQPHLSEIQLENENSDDDDNSNSAISDIDKNTRIPFLSNKSANDSDQDRSIIISLLDAKAPLTKKEKDNLVEMIQKSIINDDIDNFQFLVSSTNTFINKEISKIDLKNEKLSTRITLIDFAALNGSIKIFKFLIMNKLIIVNKGTVINAIEGGNYDIIHIIESNDISLFNQYSDEKSYLECAISSNQTQILDYLIDNYNYDLFNSEHINVYFIKSIENYNYDIFYRILTYEQNKTDNQENSIISLIEKLNTNDTKTTENIMKRIIYNGATQMFIYFFQNFTFEMKEKVCHQCMKDSFESESKDILEFMLKDDKISAESNFEHNFTIYKDDMNFLVPAERNNLNFVLYLFDLVEENVKNEELKVSFLSKNNSSNQNIFHLAAKNNWIQIIDFFVNKEPYAIDCATANDYQNNTPLHIASENHSTPFLESFVINKEIIYTDKDYIDHLNSVNYDGLSPYLVAVDRGFLDIVEFLSNVDEINMNARDNLGQNALQIAVKNNRPKIFKYLILNTKLVTSHPNNPNFSRSINFLNKDVNGQNILHIAVYGERLEMIKEIIELKGIFTPSLLNEKDNENHTSLHFAAYTGNVEIVKILLDFADLDVDAKGIENETPLHWAAENGFFDVVKLLCEKGHADFKAVDKNGKTPKQRAELNGQNDVVNYLNNLEEIDKQEAK